MTIVWGLCIILYVLGACTTVALVQLITAVEGEKISLGMQILNAFIWPVIAINVFMIAIGKGNKFEE